MTGIDRLAPCFVEDVPDSLEPGIFYVSLEHGSMMHLCACGCGHEVALPLTPLDWRFTFDGETISVAPSVGSWSLPCRSHYIIDRGRVRWAGDWSDEQIEAGRAYDRRRREASYGSDAGTNAANLSGSEQSMLNPDSAASHDAESFGGLRRWFARLLGRR